MESTVSLIISEILPDSVDNASTSPTAGVQGKKLPPRCDANCQILSKRVYIS